MWGECDWSSSQQLDRVHAIRVVYGSPAGTQLRRLQCAIGGLDLTESLSPTQPVRAMNMPVARFFYSGMAIA